MSGWPPRRVSGLLSRAIEHASVVCSLTQVTRGDATLHRIARFLFLCIAALGLLAGEGSAAASERTYTGALEVEHADVMDRGYSVDAVRLRVDGVALALPDRRLGYLAGKQVTLAATRRGDALEGARVVAVHGAAPAGGLQPGFPSEPPASGERRVAVLLISAATDGARRWDPAETERVVFGPQESVASYFETASGGRASLAGDVHGWYSGAYTSCDTLQIREQAMAAARADGVAFEDYHHVVVMFPRLDDCGFSGRADVYGPYSWINGDQRDVRVISHELGHNFGLQHATAEHCAQDGVPVAMSETCTIDEYGDPLDVMGSGPDHLFSGARRIGLGWLDAAQSRIADAPGVYELGSVNAGGGGVKELLVPRPGPWFYNSQLPEYFALELRTPLARFDAFAPDDPAVTGVGIRITYGPQYAGAYTRLLDLTPGSGRGHRDGQLRAGERFTDPRSGATIDVEAIAGGVARVRIGPEPVVAPGPPPTAGEATTTSSGTAPAPAPAPAASAPPAIAPDTARPALRVRRIGRSRRVRIRASDGGAGLRLEVRLGGRVVRRASGGRLTVRLPRRGRHVLEVTAIDAAGNRRARRFLVVRGKLRAAQR